MMSYVMAKFRKVTKKRNLTCEHDVIYKAKFRKVTKKRNLTCEHDVIYKAKFRKVTKKRNLTASMMSYIRLNLEKLLS